MLKNDGPDMTKIVGPRSHRFIFHHQNLVFPLKSVRGFLPIKLSKFEAASAAFPPPHAHMVLAHRLTMFIFMRI